MPDTVDPAPRLRDRQRHEVRQLIRRTIIDLALLHGVSGVSVQSVSAAAGISPRTFFNHFRSKDEALVPDLPDFDPDARRAFLLGSGTDLLTGLEQLLREHLTRVQQEAAGGRELQVMKQLMQDNPELLPRVLEVFETFDERLVALVAERTGRDASDPLCTVAAMTATATVRAAFTAWKATGADCTEALSSRITDAFAALRSVVAVPTT